MKNIFNETEIRKAIALINGDKDLFEIRIVPTAKSKKVLSGYFYDADSLIENLDKVDLRKSNVYITLGAVKTELFGREQSDCFIQGASTTSDNDIIGYRWLLVDLDPKRPAGISSSDAELNAAYKLAKKIYVYLQGLGFGEPIKAVSGNGAHLLYKIKLKNTEENRQLVEKCLKTLDALFSNDEVDVDTSTYNPSRISKLYGTLAQKGSNIKDRPHRMSSIISVNPPTITDRAYLEALASQFTEEPEKPQAYNKYNPKEFKVSEWLDRNGLRYTESSYKDGTKYILEDGCPFDSSHKAPDAAVFIRSNGAIGFKCLHNSCSCYDWKSLRLKYEPDAYEKKTVDNHIDEGWALHNRNRKINPQPVENFEAPLFETALEIVEQPEKSREFIKTGINLLDQKLRGLEKGKLSVITGLRGGSKSTILSQFLLEAIKDGHRCIAYSGELSDTNFIDWMMLQAAGKDFCTEDEHHKGYYFVKPEIKHEIALWMADRFYLYNNIHGHDFKKLLTVFRKQVEAIQADLLVIDNLMSLDISSFNAYDKYEAQTDFVRSLKVLAMETNCHIVFVAHPRKANGLLRLEDVSGTANLTNYIDNAFIVHRVNEDFKRNAMTTFHWNKDCEQFKATNVIEIAKDREGGTQDFWINLFYEPESKRLKNYKAEMKWYGWRDFDSPTIPEGFEKDNDIDF